ncbi:MAG: glycosyltransferase [Patescibacteria group bacterium]
MNKQSFSSNKHFDLSIVLPVYNEGENITTQIIALEKDVINPHEILIVYDFDEDNTIPYARKLQRKFKSVILVKNNFGKGVINAVKTGIKNAKGKVVVIMPADLADEPKTVNKMYTKMEDGFDIVCASRYGKGGKKIGGGFLKTLLSRFAGQLSPFLLGIPTTDISNGFKMYKRNIFDKIKIESTGGWEYSCEIIIKAYHAGFKIGDVPTVWRDRTVGKSKFKLLKWLPKYVRWYLYGILVRLNVNRLRF